jgi:hypothetical protein
VGLGCGMVGGYQPLSGGVVVVVGVPGKLAVQTDGRSELVEGGKGFGEDEGFGEG